MKQFTKLHKNNSRETGNITFNSSMENIDTAIGDTRFLSKLHYKHGGQWIPWGRFDHHGVATN